MTKNKCLRCSKKIEDKTRAVETMDGWQCRDCWDKKNCDYTECLYQIGSYRCVHSEGPSQRLADGKCTRFIQETRKNKPKNTWDMPSPFTIRSGHYWSSR